jgi:signal peptidase II
MSQSQPTTLTFGRVIAFAAPFYLLDQITKWLVLTYLGEPYEGRSFTVIPDVFELVSVANTGAAFGTFSNNNAFFVGLSAFVIGVVFALCRFRVLPVHRAIFFGVGLILAGILGNVTDRLLRGHVVDFLQFDFHIRGANPFPSFNVADACICIAAICFIFDSFQSVRADAKQRC